MKNWIRRMLRRLRKWLSLDLNTYTPYRPYPRNRRERRRLEWEDEHPWTMAWKGSPGHKWREYIGPAYHALSQYYKRKEREHQERIKKFKEEEDGDIV